MLTAAEAAERLGISITTLYAYVSRGLIRSFPDPKNPRGRLYSEEDVERRRPEKAAERALHWGGPVLESAITLISGDRLYYRGHDVVELARTNSVEDVASLIWMGTMSPAAFALTQLHVVSGGATEGLPFINRASSILPIVGARGELIIRGYAVEEIAPNATFEETVRILGIGVKERNRIFLGGEEVKL